MVGQHQRMSDQRETLIARVENDFTLHSPTNPEVSYHMDVVRAKFKALAHDVAHILPTSREQSLALTKLEEGLFYAIAALARYQDG